MHKISVDRDLICSTPCPKCQNELSLPFEELKTVKGLKCPACGAFLELDDKHLTSLSRSIELLGRKEKASQN